MTDMAKLNANMTQQWTRTIIKKIEDGRLQRQLIGVGDHGSRGGMTLQAASTRRRIEPDGRRFREQDWGAWQEKKKNTLGVRFWHCILSTARSRPMAKCKMEESWDDVMKRHQTPMCLKELVAGHLKEESPDNNWNEMKVKDADTKSISWATINIHEKVAKLPSEHLPRRVLRKLVLQHSLVYWRPVLLNSILVSMVG